MSRVFITGIGGFVGSHLVRDLLLADYEIGGFLLPEEPTMALESVRERLALFRGDILHNKVLKSALADFQPEFILHLAALAPVGQSLIEPVRYQRVNCEGTVAIAEIAKQLGSLQLFVFASSSEIYGLQPNQSPFHEDAPPKPVNPYGASKLAAEVYLKVLERNAEFPLTILRFCNTYGRKSGLYVIEYFIRQALRNEPLIVKTPEAFRDFLYIDDHVAAYRAALAKQKPGVYNIGTGQPISMHELAEKIIVQLDSTSEATTNKALVREQLLSSYVSLNSDKARRELDWKPKIPLEQGIKLTAESIRSSLG